MISRNKAFWFLTIILLGFIFIIIFKIDFGLT
jgi:hypothetical protein